MSNRQRQRQERWRRLIGQIACTLQAALLRAWRLVRRADRVPIVVLVVDPRRRREIERQLRAGLRQLRPVLGDLVAQDVAVVAQQVVQADHQLAGSCQVGQRPDGRRFTLLRLALEVDGRALGSDELLAVLAEQCVAVAVERSGPSALVPFELGTATNVGAGPDHRPLDPLAPHPNGRGGAPTERAA